MLSCEMNRRDSLDCQCLLVLSSVNARYQFLMDAINVINALSSHL